MRTMNDGVKCLRSSLKTGKHAGSWWLGCEGVEKSAWTEMLVLELSDDFFKRNGVS